MKKCFKIIVLTLFVLLTGCSKYNTYTAVSYSELETKLNNKDSFVLVIGSATCSHCAEYKLTMEKVIQKNNIQIFYVDLDGLSDEDYSKMYSKYTVKSTPTTLFIKDGVEESSYNRIVGTKSYSEIVEILKNQGYLGE